LHKKEQRLDSNRFRDGEKDVGRKKERERVDKVIKRKEKKKNSYKQHKL
jgi:hypothetical protein